MGTTATRPWTREEYHRAAEAGVFGPEERLELFAGEVIRKMSPQRRPHRRGIRHVVRALERVYGEQHTVWYQLPLVLSEDTEPEPDVMVLRGPEERYDDRDAGPADVVLLVEVSDTTLAFDRGRKASRYAAEGTPEYWLLDVSAGRLEVRRHPIPDSDAEFGWSFGYTEILGKGDVVSVPGLEGITIPTERLIPHITRARH